jgi:hypothetical protein
MPLFFTFLFFLSLRYRADHDRFTPHPMSETGGIMPYGSHHIVVKRLGGGWV